MKRVFCGLFAVAFLCSFLGCGGSAIRDKEVYKAELAFIESATIEQVERGISLINNVCVCEKVGDLPAQFTNKECLDLAQTIVVVRARMRYHLDFMEYLGGMSDTRPPETPPDIPSSNDLCKEAE